MGIVRAPTGALLYPVHIRLKGQMLLLFISLSLQLAF
jgi:hypothetical protein